MFTCWVDPYQSDPTCFSGPSVLRQRLTSRPRSVCVRVCACVCVAPFGGAVRTYVIVLRFLHGGRIQPLRRVKGGHLSNPFGSFCITRPALISIGRRMLVHQACMACWQKPGSCVCVCVCVCGLFTATDENGEDKSSDISRRPNRVRVDNYFAHCQAVMRWTP